MVLLYSFFSVCPQITFWRFYEKPPNGRKVWRQVYHRPRYFGLNHDHIWFWRVGILKMSYPNGRKFWSIVYLWPRYFGLGASIALAQNLAPPTGRHGWHVFATLVCRCFTSSIFSLVVSSTNKCGGSSSISRVGGNTIDKWSSWQCTCRDVHCSHI